MKTYSAKPTDVTRKWHIVDATEAPLGRLSTAVATLLTGKSKPMFTPHTDCGDYVIVINANNLVVTGQKLNDKTYTRHSGYPGSLKTTSLKEKMSKNPKAAIEHAVRGMLPDNKLRAPRLARLKVYEGNEHQHEAQKPEKFSIKENS